MSDTDQRSTAVARFYQDKQAALAEEIAETESQLAAIPPKEKMTRREWKYAMSLFPSIAWFLVFILQGEWKIAVGGVIFWGIALMRLARWGLLSGSPQEEQEALAVEHDIKQRQQLERQLIQLNQERERLAKKYVAEIGVQAGDLSLHTGDEAGKLSLSAPTRGGLSAAE